MGISNDEDSVTLLLSHQFTQQLELTNTSDKCYNKLPLYATKNFLITFRIGVSQMTYLNSHKGKFIDRPNRFVANVEIDGQRHLCHVKNTGRCKELLLPGSTVYLEKSDNPNRKTAYDLVAVEKGNLLINIDSQAPNKVVFEWLKAGGLFPENTFIQPEIKYENSRLDFYVEHENRKAFIEVKGVTLEANRIAAFPDAPTLRGIRHIHHLMDIAKEGYEAYLIFVVQFKPVKYVIPNTITHPEFGETLRQAALEGVTVLAYDCIVTPETLLLDKRVPVKL